MSGSANIYDATMTPSKKDIARTWAGTGDLAGSYRLNDGPNEQVWIEVLLARDIDDRLIQIPLTYRSAEIDPKQTLTTVQNSVLGKCWVTNALGDPAAVREFIRTILTGDHGADSDDGAPVALDVHGTGDLTECELSELELSESTRQRAVGTVNLNGKKTRFMLRLPHVLSTFKKTGPGHSATDARLVASAPDDDKTQLLVAEFNWLE